MENFFKFGYDQCAIMGNLIGFGAREGLFIYLSILGGLSIKVYDIFHAKDKYDKKRNWKYK